MRLIRPLRKMPIAQKIAAFIFCLIIGIFLTACEATGAPASTLASTPTLLPVANLSANACQVTEPVWTKPPEDSAVLNEPEFGYYFLNADRSIWASSWSAGGNENYSQAREEGFKVGWFRPAGSKLEISGRRLDAQAPPLEADVPCCYPTRFQATGLYFPTEGCWEVRAKAADSVLLFVVWVEP